jgi:integrase
MRAEYAGWQYLGIDPRRRRSVIVRQNDNALILVGPHGGRLRRSNFGDDWTAACRAANLTLDTHFHDLRHTGNTLASQSGASTREPMPRMGHSTLRAALIYQHMTSERDHLITDRMGEAAHKALGEQDPPKASGTRMAHPE